MTHLNFVNHRALAHPKSSFTVPARWSRHLNEKVCKENRCIPFSCCRACIQFNLSLLFPKLSKAFFTYIFESSILFAPCVTKKKRNFAAMKLLCIRVQFF